MWSRPKYLPSGQDLLHARHDADRAPGAGLLERAGEGQTVAGDEVR